MKKPKFRVICPICGKTAFYTIKMHEYGDTIEAKDFVLLNGEVPNNYDRIKCGFCGRVLGTIEISWIHENI